MASSSESATSTDGIGANQASMHVVSLLVSTCAMCFVSLLVRCALATICFVNVENLPRIIELLGRIIGSLGKCFERIREMNNRGIKKNDY